MVIYEIVALASALVSASFVGVSLMLLGRTAQAQQAAEEAKAQLAANAQSEVVEAKNLIAAKVCEFDDIIKKAAEANNSHATKIIEMENTIAALDERLAMLSGSLKTGAQATWQR